ncbi:MAG: DUF362 domain-containing protein [Oscillospiraceae bacterium]|nr:DUF362 domain-containing protein [Oscillospiraceae bacterium]
MNIKTRIAALCLAAALLASMLSGCGAEQMEPSAQASQTVSVQSLAAGTSASLPFTDVPSDAAYAPAVAWCYEQELMQGTSATAFSPNGTLTRAMVATVLYRAAGEPAVSGVPAFTDTRAGQWYSDAVVWANSQAIVRGYGNGLFGTDDPVTHEQLDMMVRRYMGEDPVWTGDPALKTAATRAEAAEAFYAHLNKEGSTEQDSKTLVAYFSRAGENYGVGVIEKGNTHIIADMIAAQTGGDTFEIAAVIPYPNNYDACTEVAQKEKNENARPGLTAAVDNMADYDVIFLGYPIWWGDMPMAVYTFLESYDFTGKTIVPFCTHAGSGLSGTVASIKSACPGADVLDGLAVAGTTAQNDQPSAEKAVTDWLSTSGLLAKEETGDSPVVYMTTDISPEGLLAVYKALNWTPTGKVAVKLSTGEPPASNYLRPELIANVVHEVDGTIVECNTAYGGSRASTAMHYQVAKDHGFNDIADVVILDESGSMTLPVSGGSRLTENYVGAHFEDYDSYLVLSHFKGHAMAGFGGAVKNISIGLGSSEGKCWIHSGGTSRTNAWGGDQTAFTESMAEAGKSVVDALDGQIVYVNVMNRLSVDCDCDGNPAEPDLHDIGILASTDPVALDQVCVDLIYAQKDGDGASLVNRIESRNGLHTLEHAEDIGLGSREYTLVSIDG